MTGLAADQPTSFLLNSRKLTAYLLDLGHAQGGPKAKFFLAFGFTLVDHEVLGRALLDHPRTETFIETVLGTAGDDRLVFEGPIISPDRRNPAIRTVWLRMTDTSARFITAVPLT